jgi:hypothetical protein
MHRAFYFHASCKVAGQLNCFNLRENDASMHLDGKLIGALMARQNAAV